ncbi:tetratricopeptide repeat protein [Planctomicrobium piriforme]|uniref:Tetratricopeptide repeat-containing protein n=1 Tax=Planctomicrobium piriforme TaxID=1576369 RepID=A0A1I3TB96_9PLAN|nr:hypothetical protein [Planctomicrobium piriforme]SFJ68225.1 hypothetical protein SAMN05421753_1295 [Planctomicrobium piriforme]
MVADNSESPSEPVDESPAAADAPLDTAQTEPDASAEPHDDFPEYEELTPELLEDECLRGDVMLRWALILLSVLLGWTFITETKVLVGIRTGEYLLSHGVLPPRFDVFSATAAGRPWVNLGWLSDLTVGATHQFLGMPWLSILCAVTVGLTFWCLSRITIPGVTTWWGSVCGVLALLALFPVFQPGSSTVAVLGLVLLMWGLARWTTSPATDRSWLLIPLFVFWTNLDPRCWIGLLLLAMFSIGELLSPTGKTPVGRRRLMFAGIALLAGVFVSPWPISPATQFLTAYREAVEARSYLGISEFFHRLDYTWQHLIFWTSLDFYSLASLVLMVLAAVTLVLNRSRLHFGWVFVWLGVNALGFFYGDSICYAAIVNAVIAILNGQDWCRSAFKMDYSITTPNVLWSRAGRAVTVLGFFLLAYLAINGALMGPQSRRIGLGLDPRWRNRITSLEEEVLPNTFSDRIFPTMPAQGDLMIWLGKKPFVDSRLGLYLGGPENLLKLHKETRAALFPGREVENAAAGTELWKSTLAKYEITDVFARLWGAKPAYGPFFQLYANPSFVLTGLGSAGANLTRNDLPSPELKAHLEKFGLTDFAKVAFRPPQPPEVIDLQAVWPLPVSKYDRWMIQKLQVTPPAAELASHYNAILTESGKPFTQQQAAGLAMLAARTVREALIVDPNSALAYRSLGNACGVLQQVEQQTALQSGVQASVEMYETQILSAAFSAAIAGQEDPDDLLKLFQILLAQRSLDTAIDVLARYDRAIVTHPIQMSVDRRLGLEELRRQVQDAVNSVKEQIATARGEKRPALELAGMALAGNCPQLALSILEEDLTRLASEPELQLLYATLLLKNGRIETAFDQIDSLQAKMNGPNAANVPPFLKNQWKSVALAVNLSAQNLGEVVKLSEEEQDAFWKSGLTSLLQLPFTSMKLPIQMQLWPAYEARVTFSAAIELPERWAVMQMQAVRAELQLGRLEAATTRLQRLVKMHPQFSQRSIAAMYLVALTGKPYEFPPNANDLPAWMLELPIDPPAKPATPVAPAAGSDPGPLPPTPPGAPSTDPPPAPPVPVTPP